MLTEIAFLLVVVYFPMAPAPEVLPGQVLMQGGPGVIPGGTPGGIGPCESNITPLHSQVAKVALNQIGPGYSLRRILSVRTQVVAGRMFYFTLHVSSVDSIAQGQCETCEVTALHKLPNAVGIQEVEIQNYSCKRVCCFA